MRDHRREPPREVVHRGGVGLRHPEPRLLHGVLRFAHRAQHAVRDRTQAQPVLLELRAACVERCVGHVRLLSFVIDMTENADSEAIVRTTVSLGHELNLKVVAEGVENRAALNHLATLSCDVAQGYFIAKPLPPADFIEWIEQGTWHRPDVEPRTRKPSSTVQGR